MEHDILLNFEEPHFNSSLSRSIEHIAFTRTKKAIITKPLEEPILSDVYTILAE